MLVASFSEKVILPSSVFASPSPFQHQRGLIYSEFRARIFYGRSQSPYCECSYNSIELLTHDFTSLTLGCLIRLDGSRAPCIVSPARDRFFWSMKGITLDILIEVSLLDQYLDLLLKLVTFFNVVAFDSIKLTPFTWFRIHYILLWSQRCRDVMHVNNLTPYLFTTGVPVRGAKLSGVLHTLLNIILFLMREV